VWFSHIKLLIILSESCFYCKNTNFDQKAFYLLWVKTKVGPINSQRNNFIGGNIFVAISTLVLSLWSTEIVASGLHFLSSPVVLMNKLKKGYCLIKNLPMVANSGFLQLDTTTCFPSPFLERPINFKIVLLLNIILKEKLKKKTSHFHF